MSNTLTQLIPDLYQSLDIVSRELAGFIPSVTLDASAERAALNQPIRIPLTPAAKADDVTPGQLPPDNGDQIIDNVPLTITKSRMVPFRWEGEQQKGIKSGPGYHGIRRDQVTQAMRTLVNEIEVDLGQLFRRASRAAGEAGKTPFKDTLTDTAQVRKILTDNGAPLSDLQCVIDTTAGAALRTMAQLTRANEAGTTSLRAQGTLLELHGFTLRESAGVASLNGQAGAASKLAGDEKIAVGSTFIPLAITSQQASLGDVLVAGNHKYVIAKVDSEKGVHIFAPGVREEILKGTELKVVGKFTANFAFSRSAIILATRAPALPEEGDMADDRIMITDPRTNMSFEVSMYKQYRRVRYEIAAAWGCQNIKPEHTAVLLG
ncbi:P22 coat protein-gene protein 5 [Candidatus Pantoea symbiotica]|uniref:P22 coat protein-gene protein 5 n=1 Tax=Candidatus Pantoea symbiotica TaxID=1884370 RepID=A0A1I3YM11_9GAMM|nr:MULTISPECIES: P22 phage major capsid protein family protein [Pantoea]SFK32908.1 P22 coat protein-gene protein 5 [Pantoea symbiotica]SFU86378.1 P22 coat protein-gene protein 5 [Pantoea sp. YR525]